MADGVVEVMLLGQNVNSYGKNLEEPMTFARLLQEVEKIEGLERIRFMTSHPKDPFRRAYRSYEKQQEDLPSHSPASSVREQPDPEADEPPV